MENFKVDQIDNFQFVTRKQQQIIMEILQQRYPTKIRGCVLVQLFCIFFDNAPHNKIYSPWFHLWGNFILDFNFIKFNRLYPT